MRLIICFHTNFKNNSQDLQTAGVCDDELKRKFCSSETHKIFNVGHKSTRMYVTWKLSNCNKYKKRLLMYKKELFYLYECPDLEILGADRVRHF